MTRGRRYGTDLNEAAWALVALLLPPTCRRGRPRTTDLRAVFDAILYLLHTGCQPVAPAAARLPAVERGGVGARR